MLVDLLSDPVNYTITVVDNQGNVAHRYTARKRSAITVAGDNHALQLPYVSTSNSSLYYLDGDSTIKTVWLDGRTLPDLSITGIPAGSEAAFAVSPDESTLAYSVLDYTVNPVRVTLFTRPLLGNSPKALFTSTTDYVWPVAWHGGLLVLAHAVGAYAENIAALQGGWDNPYQAVSYHLVDPATGVRKVTMGACNVSGPLSQSGSACSQGGAIDWTGKVTEWAGANWGSVNGAAALSDDGTKVAAVSADDQTHLSIYTPGSGGVGYVEPLGVHDWAGWMGDMVLTGSYEDSSFEPQLVTVAGGLDRAVAAQGFFAAVFPTTIY